MKAIVKSVRARMCEKKDKSSKFKVVDIECDVINEHNEVVRRKYSGGAEFIAKYMKYCQVTSEQLIGMEVDVQLAKRVYTDSEGKEKTYNFIKYLRVLDGEGKPIYMPKDDEDVINPGF